MIKRSTSTWNDIMYYTALTFLKQLREEGKLTMSEYLTALAYVKEAYPSYFKES